ncbi:MAG TPA: hypothetical protein VGO54_04000 [Bradyrhizobium sp.]|jgi:hypothetical protein|nr:hypothetical protein [Bradyrhizobium sp.]
MTTSPSGFDPWWIFRAPWSGNVAQRITAPWFSPSLTVNYAGDAAVEDRVVMEVASYGRQLGWLTEIVIALAKGQPAPRETLRRLETAAKEIEVIKNQIRASAVGAANEALDRLERDDPAQYAKLLRDRRSDTLS